MIRDMDLLRNTVLALEKITDTVSSYDIEIPGASHDEVAYHCLLLQDAGFLDVASTHTSATRTYDCLMIKRLTNPAHEFLSQVRNDAKWNIATKAMSVVKMVTIPILLDSLRQMTQRGWDQCLDRVAKALENLSL